MNSTTALIIICLSSFGAAFITFFSGFGLGTLLMPVLAIFVDIRLAIAATALVHLANNIFKAGLIFEYTNWSVVLRFAAPAAVTAMLGAVLLHSISDVEPLFTYIILGSKFEITVTKLLIGLLIIGFAILELTPAFQSLSIDEKYISFGGMLSGFFGGISGHQGALRSVFLIKAGLSKEAYIGASAMSAVIVDVARLAVYGYAFIYSDLGSINQNGLIILIAAASGTAFVGSYIGRLMLHKVTMKAVQLTVAIMLLIIGSLLGVGII